MEPYTLNAEIIVCIYYCDFDLNAILIFRILRKNVSLDYCVYNVNYVKIFAIIKKLAIISEFTVL